MNKRGSLAVLVANSFFLTKESKDRILNNLDNMSNDEISILGHFLASEKKISLESKLEMILDQLIRV